MFNLENAIKEWKRTLRKHPDFEDGDIEELESHLRDEIDLLMADEHSEESAFITASEHIGEPGNIGNELHVNRSSGKRFTPVGLQNSGIAMLLPSYIKVAWRNLINRKSYSLINILGLAVGLCSCMLIALYVQYELSYDAFHQKSDRIYRVLREFDIPGLQTTISTTPPSLAPSAKQTLPVIEETVRLQNANLSVEYGDKKFVETGFLNTEDSFFNVFSFPLLEGHIALNNMNTVLITKRMVPKYFGNEQPLGKTLTVAGRELEVTGILVNPPSNSSLQFDFIGSIWRDDESWGRNSYTTFFLLNENADKGELTSQLSSVINQNIDPDNTQSGNSFIPHLQPVTGIHLGQGVNVDIDSRGNIQYLYLFIALALFIIVLACINFMNLATARSMERAREVGMRKALGGIRSQIALQFLGESLLLSFLAALLAVFLTRFGIPLLNNIAGTEVSFQNLLSVRNTISLFLLILVTGLIAGTFPAIVLSKFQPSKVLKGAFSVNQNSFLRKVLVVFQFTISIALLAGTALIFKQVQFMKNKGLGFNPDRVILVKQANFLANNRDPFLSQLLSIPGIENASSGFSVPGSFYVNSMWKPDTPDAKDHNFNYTFINPDYVEALELEILAGRSFSSSFPADTFNVILNEAAVSELGWTPQEAVKHKLIKDPYEFDIVGVVKDFNYYSLHSEITPLAMFGPRRPPLYVIIRISENTNLPAIVESIDTEWRKFSDFPLEYSFLADDLKAQYRTEKQLIQVFGVFAALGIFIGCLGLFGLTAFLVSKRTKEIGIRKILGANSIQVITLISSDLIKLVGIGFIIAVPLAWLLMDKWLQDFAYKTKISMWIFIGTGSVALAIALFTVSGQALKAALMNPSDSLKSE